VAGVVDDHVQSAVVCDDPGDPGLDRGVAGDVQFDGAQVDRLLGRVAGDLGDLRGVAVFGLAPVTTMTWFWGDMTMILGLGVWTGRGGEASWLR
jgi:hypothetical protein